MKAAVRRLLLAAGFELKHASGDRIVREIDSLREKIRLGSKTDNWRPHDLAHPGFLDHLGRVLELHDPDLILDVGASRGQFAQSIRSLGFRGKMVSFEPVPHLYKELVRLRASDPEWSIVNAAVGDEPGVLDLRVFSDDTLSSLHVPRPEAKKLFAPYFAGETIVRTQVISIEAWLSESGAAGTAGRILLKTDTQGNDLAVLKGAGSALRRTSIVLAEVSFIAMYENSPTYREMFRFLEEAGFIACGLFPMSHRSGDLALIEMDAIFARPR